LAKKEVMSAFVSPIEEVTHLITIAKIFIVAEIRLLWISPMSVQA